MNDLYDGLLDLFEGVISFILNGALELFSTFYNFFRDILGELRPSFVNIGVDFFSLLDEDITSYSIMSTDVIFWALGLIIVIFILKPLISFISDLI